MTRRKPLRRLHLSRPLLIATIGALAVGAVAPPAATAVNYSHPATYSGTAAGGGTVEFDVSADGSAVTRFATHEVNTDCGAVSSTSTGTLPIVNESFSRTTSGTGTSFEGSFPALQQAQGTLTLRISVFPISCTSDKVSWTATTPTPPSDTTAPQTKISSGPSIRTSSHKAKLRFGSNEPGSTFECKLDGKRWGACRSPKTYRNLEDGKHVFRVRARDAAGNVDPTAAKRSWRIV